MTTFQYECLRLIDNIVGISGGAFYFINNRNRHSKAVLYQIPTEAEKDYDRHFSSYDPLNPELNIIKEGEVAHLSSVITQSSLQKTTYYQDFMSKYDQAYVIDLYIKLHKSTVAVVSLTRNKLMGDFKREEINQIKFFREFICKNIEPYLIQSDYSGKVKASLTRREKDVLSNLLDGKTNKEISDELGITEATTKTHINKIFKKYSVKSRSSLIVKLNE